MSFPCLLFTDITVEDGQSVQFKYEMGWLVVGWVVFNVGVNMLVMIVMNVRMLYRVY